jgi:hypothetical protein
MKKLIKSFVLLFVLLSLTAITFGQTNVASANATATLVAPITIARTAHLNFGDVYVSAATPGTIVIGTDGTRSATGGAGLPAIGAVGNAATFDVTGTNNDTYTITLSPASINITDVAGLNPLVVDTFTQAAAAGVLGTLSATGTQTINVGATLTLPANHPTGAYSSANPSGQTFSITVNYN